LFSPLAKKHFKELPEQIAVIEICHQLESGFITGWHLISDPLPYTSARRPLDVWTEVRGMSPNSSLSVYFVNQGITNPSEMLRIIFTSYHRKINGEDPGLQYIINTYKTYWSSSRRLITLESRKPDAYGPDPAIIIRDDSILNTWLFYKTHLMDTLTVAYFYENYRFTKKPMEYSIKAVIAQADTAQKHVRVKLIDIKTSKKSSTWYEGKNAWKVGDTIDTKLSAWVIKGLTDYYYV
jgi:hypothetical protein